MIEKRVLILHGLGGSDFPHWQAYLEKDLIEQNTAVSFLDLPNKDNPNLEDWKDVVKKEIEEFKPTIVVCHSLGNVLWFHLCEELEIKLDKLMLVAPVRNESLDDAKTFFPYPIPKDLKAKDIMMTTSNNDPYISVEEAIRLESKFRIKMKILQNAGHINVASGFGRLNCVLDWINDKGEFGEGK